MGNTKEIKPPAAAANPPAKALSLSAADAAKAVKRPVPVIDEAGKPTGETAAEPVLEEEVMAWALRGTRVIVVTTDGQKLEGSL